MYMPHKNPSQICGYGHQPQTTSGIDLPYTQCTLQNIGMRTCQRFHKALNCTAHLQCTQQAVKK